MFPKSSFEYKTLIKLNTTEKIQTFLDSIPFNNRLSCMSVRRVLEKKRAHCFEGAFVAAACLVLMGEKPIIVSLKVKKPDDDHILVIFKRNGFYGAMSKTSHPVLRYRDPVYKSIRELVMSYFHEYFLFKTGAKTMLGYTKPINLEKFGFCWITDTKDQWDLAIHVHDMPTTSVIPKQNKRYIRTVTTFERTALDVLEWK